MTDELDELRCLEYDLIEQGYVQVVKLRGFDVVHDVFQVFTDPFEIKKMRERGGQSGSGEAGVGLPSQGEIEGIRIQGKDF